MSRVCTDKLRVCTSYEAVFISRDSFQPAVSYSSGLSTTDRYLNGGVIIALSSQRPFPLLVLACSAKSRMLHIIQQPIFLIENCLSNENDDYFVFRRRVFSSQPNITL